MTKKFSNVTQQQKDVLKKIMNYFYSNGTGAPYRTDYIVLRMAQEATNEYTDTIFIPNFNNEDNFEFLHPFKCNAYPSSAAKIITGSYQYRLAERFGLVYGQQMSHVYYENTMLNETYTDYEANKLMGINLIAHPVHALIPLLTPISNASKGSILIHPSAHSLMKANFKNNDCKFNLYVVDINFLL
jgi:hypothetical protein